MINEDAIAARVTRRLRAKGVSMMLKRSVSTYDPGSETSETVPNDVPFWGIMFPPTENDVATLAAPAPTDDKERQLIYAAVPFNAPLPIEGELIVVPNAGTWTVVKAGRLAPNGKSLLWTILVHQ